MHPKCPACGSRIITVKACHSCGENFHAGGGKSGGGGGGDKPKSATEVVEHLSKETGSDITVSRFSGPEGNKTLDLHLHDGKMTTMGRAVSAGEKLNGWQVTDAEPGRIVLQQKGSPKPAAPPVKPLSSASEVKSIITKVGGIPGSSVSVQKVGKETHITFPKQTPKFREITSEVLSRTNAPGAKYILQRGDPEANYAPHINPGKKTFILRER